MGNLRGFWINMRTEGVLMKGDEIREKSGVKKGEIKGLEEREKGWIWEVEGKKMRALWRALKMSFQSLENGEWEDSCGGEWRTWEGIRGENEIELFEKESREKWGKIKGNENKYGVFRGVCEVRTTTRNRVQPEVSVRKCTPVVYIRTDVIITIRRSLYSFY